MPNLRRITNSSWQLVTCKIPTAAIKYRNSTCALIFFHLTLHFTLRVEVRESEVGRSWWPQNRFLACIQFGMRVSKHCFKSRYLHHLIQGTELVAVSCSYPAAGKVIFTLNICLTKRFALQAYMKFPASFYKHSMIVRRTFKFHCLESMNFIYILYKTYITGPSGRAV